MKVVLLTTAGCHLCDDARDLLHSLQGRVSVTEVDIACDDALIERYALRIPVIKVASSELDWPFDNNQLSSFLGIAG